MKREINLREIGTRITNIVRRLNQGVPLTHIILALIPVQLPGVPESFLVPQAMNVKFVSIKMLSAMDVIGKDT